MEASLIDLLHTILKSSSINVKTLVETHSDAIKTFVSTFEDPDIHARCNGKNKNGKRCSKAKKEGSEYCAIHLSQNKDKDSEFILTETLGKSSKEKEKEKSTSKSLQILETNKKKGILPEKIKKIIYDGKKYYVNKNDWIYEMDQSSEVISSDIPIGKLFSGKLIQLKIQDI
jgi:hypothetical protein